MKKKSFVIRLFIILFVFPLSLLAQQSAEKFIVETNYLLYHPEGYENDTTKQWPLVLFLHGAGETGNDIERVKAHGPSKLISQGRQFPFIVVSPQAAAYGWEPKDLVKLYRHIMAGNRVDPDRVYLTGISMGGFGTWAMAMEYPELFAAIIPICGGGDTSKVRKLRHTPVWCFHGDQDNVVPISASEKMVDALRKYSGDVKFTIYPGVDHDSWTMTYENDSIYDWLLEHKRFRNEAVVIDKSILQSYCGTYKMGGEEAVLALSPEENGIQMKFGQRNGPLLYPLNENTFFIEPYSRIYISTHKDAGGRVSGFTMDVGDKQLVYTKTE